MTSKAEKLRRIRQRQKAGRPRKEGERYPSGDLRRPSPEIPKSVRDATIERVLEEAEKRMFPLQYVGKNLAGVNCVYFVNQVGTRLYKIGFTRDLRQRLKTLSTGSSMILNPVAWVCIKDPARLWEAEAMAHKQAHLLGEHMRGEWFKIEPCYISLIVTGMMGLRDQIIGVAMDEFHEVHSVIAKADQLMAEEAAS